MNVARENIAWLAGLLDGEGYFASSTGAPRIHLAMTDEDIVQRVAALTGGRIHSSYQKPNRKRVFRFSANGELAVYWMEAILPFMGERRAARIGELLVAWRSRTKPYRRQGELNPAPCHPDRPLRGRGMCKQCYMRDYRVAYRERRKLLGSAAQAS